MRLADMPFWRRLWDGDSQPPQATLEETIPVAEVVEPAAEIERRAALRMPCHREAWLRPVTLIQNAPWHAIVLDVSTGGIGLAIERPVHTGTFFAIDLPDPLSGNTKTVRARVVHATAQNHNYWHMGCVFETELTGAELETLV
jgi:hypothetical protein